MIDMRRLSVTGNRGADVILEFEKLFRRAPPCIDIAVGDELSFCLRTVPHDESRLYNTVGERAVYVVGLMTADCRFTAFAGDSKRHVWSPEI